MPIGVNDPKKLGVVPSITSKMTAVNNAMNPVSAAVAATKSALPTTGVVPALAQTIKSNTPTSTSQPTTGGATALAGGGYAPPVNAATSQGAAAPSTGYGSGGTYGTTPGLGAAYAANSAALANTPGFKESEIARTQAVIAERKAQGLDTSLQEKYLTNQLGYVQPQEKVSATSTTANGGVVPDYIYNTQTSGQLQQYAADQTAIDRAALKNAIDTKVATLKGNAEYSNQLLQDNRALSDAEFDRNINPFTGRKGYLQAQTERGRAIDDNQRMGELNNQLASLATELADFDKLTPERQRQIYQDLLNIERNFAINQAGVTGTYGGNQTLAAKTADQNYQLGLSGLSGNLPGGGRTIQGQQLDWNMDPSNPQNQGQVLSNDAQKIANQISQLQLDNLPAEIKANLTLLDQQVKAGSISNESAAYQLSQLKDPNSLTNRALLAETTIKELEAKNLPEQQRLELQALRKQIANIGKTAPKSEAQLLEEQVRVAEANARLEELKNPTPKKISYKDDPEFAKELDYIKQYPNTALNDIRSKAAEIIEQYGPEAYQEMIKAATPKK